MANKSVADILAQADNNWICPITNKVFDRSDLSAIEKHKAEVIAAETEKERASARNKKIAKLKRSWCTVGSIKELTAWINASAEIYEIEVKNLSFAVNYDHASKIKPVRTDSLLVSFDNIKACTKLSKLGITERNGKFVIFIESNRLTAKLADAVKQSRRTVVIDESNFDQFVTQFPSYKENVSEVKKLSATVHELRERIREINDEIVAQRQEFKSSFKADIISAL